MFLQGLGLAVKLYSGALSLLEDIEEQVQEQLRSAEEVLDAIKVIRAFQMFLLFRLSSFQIAPI